MRMARLASMHLPPTLASVPLVLPVCTAKQRLMPVTVLPAFITAHVIRLDQERSHAAVHLDTPD